MFHGGSVAMQIKECIVLSWAGSAEPAHRFANPQKTTIFAEKPRHLATEGTYELHYIHKDHLGSWTTITDAGGQVIAEQSFDAWGNMRDPETWSCDYNNTPMFDRGFTGHEHLHMFGLINMNGRVYDPVMSMFLSHDNYVQAPDNSQNFNRYAYCLNNPLKYTDPSGWQMVGGMKPNPFHENWSMSHVAPAHGPSAFVNPYNLLNMALYGNLYGPNEVVGGGGGSSMDALYGTYGHYVTHQANSVLNYTFPSTQLHLIRNWHNNPCRATNSDIRDAGITNVTVGEVNYGGGIRTSFYSWETASGQEKSASVWYESVGGNSKGTGALSLQPLGWYDGIVENRENSLLRLNSINYYRYDGHMLTSPLIHTMQGGQHVRVVMKNHNFIPVTLQIQDISAWYYDGWFKRKKYEGESYSFTLPPYQTFSRDFYHFGDFPYTWQFELSAVISDVASVEVWFYSDWVEGMPSSRDRLFP